MDTETKKMDVSFQLRLCFVSIRNFEVCVLRVSLDESFQNISGKVTLDQVDHCWSLGFHSISTMHFIHFHLHAKLQTQVHHFLRRAPIVASFEVTPKNLGGVWENGTAGRKQGLWSCLRFPIFLIKLQHVAEGEGSISSQFISATWTMSSTLNHTGLSFISRTPSASTRGVTYAFLAFPSEQFPRLI